MRLMPLLLLVIISTDQWQQCGRWLDEMCGKPVSIERDAVIYDCELILPDEPDIVDEVTI